MEFHGLQPIGIEELEVSDNTIETSCHSLFIEDIPDKFEHIPMEKDEPQNIYERIEGGKKYKLFIGNFESTPRENFRIFNKLQEAEPNSLLEIFISSDGGNFYEILDFYNVIKPKFFVTTFLSRGYSAGSLMFLIGDDRIIYEHSDFMVHSYTSVTSGKRQDLLDRTYHQDKIITRFFNKVYKPYFTKKELKKIDKGQDFWMDSEEMLKRNIATGIILDDGNYLTRDEYLKGGKE